MQLDRDVLWVWVGDPVFTKVWDLAVEGVLEKWNVFGESGKSTGTGSTPENHVTTVRPDGGEVQARFGCLISWTFNVLRVSMRRRQ